MADMNVYATTGSTAKARRFWVGRSHAKPDEGWISRNTGIDPYEVSHVKQMRLYGENSWLIFIGPDR